MHLYDDQDEALGVQTPPTAHICIKNELGMAHLRSALGHEHECYVERSVYGLE